MVPVPVVEYYIVTRDASCRVCPEYKAKEPVRRALMDGTVPTQAGSAPLRNLDAVDDALGRELIDFVKEQTGRRTVPALVCVDGDCKRIVDPMALVRGEKLPAGCEV